MKKVFSISLLLVITILLSCCVVQPDVISISNEPIIEEPIPKGEPQNNIRNDVLTVHFIDVGQGDAILIRAPQADILIDAGERGNIVTDYLKNLNIDELHIVISTHPHSDHIGGLINVLKEIKVHEVIDPGIVHTSKTYLDYLQLIDEKNIMFTEAKAGEIRNIGENAIFKILHPMSPSSSHLNDASVVVRIIYGDVSFIFMGDAEAVSEGEILKREESVESTIIKVGHHGSRTSSSMIFLNAVKPKAAVIMCGKGNTYNHPHDETINKLNAIGSDIYRTDILGTIIITTDGIEYTVDKAPTISSVQGKININTASLEELQGIMHIGTERALQIMELRPFKSLDDLGRIDGIGPARLKDIKDEGKAYVE